MPVSLPSVDYGEWRDTCDTLHAHTQLLGKLAVALAPPEPELQHAALRLTARGWETLPLPAPDGSGAIVAALDLHRHEAVVERTGRDSTRVPLTPDRPVRDVTREVLKAVRGRGGPGRDQPHPAGGDLERAARRGHRTFPLRQRGGGALLRCRDPGGTRAGGVPRALPRSLDAGERLVGLVRPGGEPVLGRPGRPAVPGLHHAQRRWTPRRWPSAGGPGTAVTNTPPSTCTHTRLPTGFAEATIAPKQARWDSELGEYVLDWNDIRESG